MSTDNAAPAEAPVDPAGRDPRDFGDELLATEQRPVARGRGGRRRAVVPASDGEILVAGHAEVVRVAEDAETFSSAVSAHLQIPNGLDGREHIRFRRLLDRYLAPDVVAEYGEPFRHVARAVVDDFLTGRTARVDAVDDLGATFAVRAMRAWLGWPAELEERLLAWIAENSAATRSRDRSRTAAVAEEFDDIIAEVVRPRLEAPDRFDDVTAELVHDTSLGRKLEFAEIVSILRNWTAGDLGSVARCIGVVLHGLTENLALQEHLRFGVSDAEFTAVVDELLRVDNPFVSNRRVTTCPVTLSGVELPEGQRVRIHWTAANRDPEAFRDVEAFDPEGNAGKNLVWGTGPHVCPGKPLSILEIRAFIEELLKAATVWPAEGTGDDGAGGASRGVHPVGGWEHYPVELERL
ncbi:cytochrome P450 [Corynebacterium halotolerans]|uniref:Cytochrome P450 n=1 Tax=Corynebacterium halotolerans YIM 70093 = DSM 44683 TaxID=1121362 RepID=M1P9K7_9CORY|nr:cytochrome P450 [Corynebacterium halotolerans]AGF73356.1 cytochrome P450 [Corynebacterium halotolerans YIM 70093 = DSM 44683]